MLRKFLVAAVFLTPLVAFAQSSSAWENANGNASFKRVPAPEIDGGNAVLGLALLGGIVSLMVRKNKKQKKDE
jgi:hypothetical protein